MPAAALVVFLLAWQYGVRAVGIPAYLVPQPYDVATSLVQGFHSGPYLSDTLATLEEIGLGFVFGSVLGLALGVTVAWSSLLDRLFTPYVVALNGLPKVAVAPLIVIWLGQGLNSKILIAALVSFFPLAINTTNGLNSIEPSQLDLMRSLAASRRQVFWKLQVPKSLPQVFAGLEIAVVLAPIGAIVGEFVGAKQGLGYLIQVAIELVTPAEEFASFVILIVVSLVLFYAVKLVERRVVFWQKNSTVVAAA